MRGAFFVFIALAVAGCGTPRQWDKPGVDRQTAKQDLRDCRRAAAGEAWRAYPDNVPMRYPWPTSSAHQAGRPDPYFARRDSDRSYNEARLSNFCMRNKGYELNPSPTDISPTSPPR